MTADVTGAPDDKYVHGNQGFIAFGRLLASDFLFRLHESPAHRHHRHRPHRPQWQLPAGVPAQPADRGGRDRVAGRPLHGQAPRRRLPLRPPQVPEEEGGKGGHARRQHQHLLRPRGRGRQRDRLRGRAQGPGRHLHRLHRARQRRDGERDLQHLQVQLRHQVLVALPQPRTVANNPAGEASLNLGITGPAYTIGAACAAGNLGLIHAAQMLRLARSTSPSAAG
jgi:hypothetical protein